MNKKQQELFVSFFEQIFEAEEVFEEIKKKMKACSQYNPSVIFDLISENSDRISISRMRDYLQDKISCNERELYELFEKMDIGRQGFISRKDFIRELTPVIEDVKEWPNGNASVSSQIEGYFISLIIQYIKRLRILEVARKQVYFIQPYDAFAEIDNFKTGIIGLGQLQRFLGKNDFQISDYQLMLLLHGLRRRCYLQVNLQVFCENLDPLQFGHYQQYQASLDADQQKQFLKRSRKQQQTMRRSRIQSWKVQHNIAKQERRKRAELQRQLQLEDRINNEILEQEKQKQRYIRRAMLQEDKNIRWNVQTGNNALQIQKQRQLLQRYRNQDLRILKNQENDVQHALIGTALRRQDDLQNSRRARYNIQRQRQRVLQQQLQLQRQAQIDRQRALAAELQLRRQQQHRQQIRQRQLLQQAQKARFLQREAYLSQVQQNRHKYEQQLQQERARAQRQYQLQRIRKMHIEHTPIGTTGTPSRYESATHSHSRRIADLERQLDRTRVEMRERQSRYRGESGKKELETADRQYRRYR